jgi:hypothetical protein
MLPAKVGSIWPSSFRGEDVLTVANQTEPNLAGSIHVRSSIKFLRFVPFGQGIWLPRAILVSDWLLLKKSSPLKLLLAEWNQTKKLYRGPYIDASCQGWLHLAKQFQRRRCFNSSQSETRIALTNLLL